MAWCSTRANLTKTRKAVAFIKSHQRAETRSVSVRGDVNFRRIHVGDKLWKTNDPELTSACARVSRVIRSAFNARWHLEVHGFAWAPSRSSPVMTTVTWPKLDSNIALVAAEKQPPRSVCANNSGRLGGTPFCWAN